MKLAKALKLKNRLAGEVTRLKRIIQVHNSRDTIQEAIYDVERTYGDLHKAIHKLILVKTAIACANAGKICKDEDSYTKTPYWNIFEMAELKGVIETLRATNAKNGQFIEGSRFGEDSVRTTNYQATFKQLDLDKLVLFTEERIDQCQNVLDAHNATCDVVDVNFSEGLTLVGGTPN